MVIISKPLKPTSVAPTLSAKKGQDHIWSKHYASVEFFEKHQPPLSRDGMQMQLLREKWKIRHIGCSFSLFTFEADTSTHNIYNMLGQCP